MRIAFIGLGNMGAPMSRNLVQAGHSVSGYDIAGHDVPGVMRFPSAVAAVQAAEVIVTMLPNGQILRSVCADILGHVEAGTVLVDCSTVDVQDARIVSRMAADHGCLALDAPVSGGTSGAAAGTLTFMVGGNAETFRRVEPLLMQMGSRAVHCGESGAGQAAKICNNMLLGISMIGVCEAFVLADKLGLDRTRLFDVASTSSGSCWSLNTYCPAPGIGPNTPADRSYAPGFAAELMLKDLTLSQRSAGAVGAATPLGQRATALYAALVDAAGTGKDFSAMLPYLSGLDREGCNG
jgi:3-hydroxyisobutyrate dehydrogenase